MSDTVKRRMQSISPAIGPYYIYEEITIDKSCAGVTGCVGEDTLTLIKTDMSYTGIEGTNFTNQKRKF